MPAPSFHRANNIIEIFVAYMLKQTLFKIFGKLQNSSKYLKETIWQVYKDAHCCLYQRQN